MYLPFAAERLLAHFADTSLGGPGPQHVQHYQASSRRALEHRARVHTGQGLPAGRQCDDLDHQVEKDERFWVASALLSIYYSEDRVAALTRLLQSCLGERPPMQGLATWQEALGDTNKLKLYFEVNLPAPRRYKEYLGGHLSERTLLPWLREIAAARSYRPEGATKVDAMLVAPATGFAVAFEAKVLSDVSTHTRYDGLRNQLARNIDVLLDDHDDLQPPLSRRRRDRTCLVLLTPQAFKEQRSARLYGWLMDGYRRDTTLLASHLPHRRADELATIPARLGWTTWEECERIEPGACSWLSSAGSRQTKAVSGSSGTPDSGG